LRLVGPGARAHLASLTASKLPQPGRTGLLYFADDRGRIVTEMTCLPYSDDDVGVITAAVAQGHDADILRKGLPAGVVLEDWSDRIHCFIVTGPKARDLLAGISRGRPDAALAVGAVSRPRWRARMWRWCGCPLPANWAGKSTATGAMPRHIYDALLAGGAKPFGMKALNAMRIEKGYRAWKGDLSTDYSLLEGGP
jgi:dimethylglycine dehydrogenase